MTVKLSDVKASAERFFIEAKFCAINELGFSALLTTFPIIISVSEAILAHKNPSKNNFSEHNLFKFFVPHIKNKSWLIPYDSTSAMTDGKLTEILRQTRNGLTHQLSQPINVFLANNITEGILWSQKTKKEYTICVKEFVNEIEATVEILINKYTNVKFDSLYNKENTRGPSNRITSEFTTSDLTNTRTSGSGGS
jgi:hypothetical protein